jgi:phosphatidylglycerol---prolipoprotein diacylglyceryl transferase
MLRHISIGPAALQTAPLIYLIGFFLLAEISRRRASHFEARDETLSNALTLSLIVGVLSARFAYVLLHWEAYRDNPGESLALNLQGMTLEAGLLASIAVTVIYTRWRGIQLRTLLDILAPGVGVFLTLVPLGFLANGDVIGQPSDVPWAIDLWSEDRHPVQLYAAFGGMATLAAWYWLPGPFAGSQMLVVAGGLAVTWLLVGFLLAEPALLANYRLVQVGGWGTLIACTFMWSLWQPESS